MPAERRAGGPASGAGAVKVLHLDLERGWRGGQQQVAYLLHHLRDLGVESLLACRAGEPLHARAAAAGARVIPLGSLAEGARRLPALIRAEGVRIVHAHSARSHNLGLLLKLRRPGVRLVVSRRVDFPRRRGPLSRWKYRTRLVVRWLAVSARVRDVLVADGVPAERIAVVRSGVDTARLCPDDADAAALPALRAELDLPGDALVVLAVGALVAHKDHATLLRAFAQAARERPALRLVIAGEGPLRADLEALREALGLAGRVRLPGFRGDVARLLHLCHLFVMASRTEGLGTSVLDAMGAGRPVVVTDAGGLPEMVRHGRNGLVVPPADPAALAAALGRMADDPVLRRACAAANRADVAAFSARRTAEDTVAVYRAVL